MTSEIPHYTVEEFTDLKKLGVGSGGEVFKGNHDDFGVVAIKAFIFSKNVPLEKYRREIEVLIKIRHPNIVHFYGILWDGRDKTNFLGYVMEFIDGGSLDQVIHNPSKNYDLPQICEWIKQIATGLQFLHRHGIMHRDIKPQNILVDGDKLKLADFGTAREIGVSNTAGIGTFLYMAPEVITGGAVPQSDIYSLAITIWEIFHRQSPYHELKRSLFDLLTAVKNGTRPTISTDKMDGSLSTFIHRCWHTDIHQRPLLKEIVECFSSLSTSNNPPKYMNILLLGETGVGKSTFINGLANYLKYSSLQEAMDKGVECLIKSSFIHRDEDYNRVEVKCEPTIGVDDGNEKEAYGFLATQSPKLHRFQWGSVTDKKLIRIIDTPGIPSADGVTQDRRFIEQIVSFIGDYPEIHAILIFLRPNHPHQLQAFRYCIQELLSALHITASKNILFCFTNIRSSHYRPGDTLSILQCYLEELYRSRGSRIPLEGNTIFCFDNEPFRFLCARNTEGVVYKEREMEGYNMSWKFTAKEFIRLFEIISQLQPHKTAKTSSVIQKRHVLFTTASALAEIVRNQRTNTRLIEEKVEELEMMKEQRNNLSTGNLYIDKIGFSARELDSPQTVCTHEDCVETVQLRTGIEAIYKQCHIGCVELQEGTTGVCPNPEIKNCVCFRRDRNKCTSCSHDWTTHMYRRYELSKTVEKIKDPEIEKKIRGCDETIEKVQLFLKAQKKKEAELAAESRRVLSQCAEPVAYIKKNAIIPYNDAFKEQLIKEERERIGAPDQELKELQQYRDEYDQLVEILGRQ